MGRTIAMAIGLNCGIALLGFYVAWRFWQLGKSWSALADTCLAWQQHLHLTLNSTLAPEVILKGQHSTAELRQRYAHLQHLVGQGQQLLRLLTTLLAISRGLRRWRTHPQPSTAQKL